MADEETEPKPPELKIKLVEKADPNDCRLIVNQAMLNALTSATADDAHQDLLGKHIVQHLKDHHNYGKPDAINLQHEVRE